MYYNMVKEFHEAMGLDVDTGKPSDVRQLLIDEERAEFLKEACDLVYVIMGHHVEVGHQDSDCYADIVMNCCYDLEMDFEGAFKEVHRSNMSKLDDNGKPIRRADGKVLKGPNYSPANMEPYI